MCCLRPRNGTDAAFIAYSIPLPLGIINDLTYSTTVKHLSSLDVRKILIGTPPGDEQLAISGFLDRETAKIDSLMARKERLIELLQEKRTALITRAVTRGLDSNVPTKDSVVAWLGEIPAHWEVNRLRYTVAGCQNGVWGDEPDGLNDILCVRVADFDRVRFRVIIDDPTYRSVKPRYAQTRRLQLGDLLLEKSGGGEKQPVGAVVVYDHYEPAVCSNFIARLAVSAGFDCRFLTYLHAALYAAQINTRSIKQSTGIQNLDSTSYLSELVGLPELAEQRAIATFLDRETAKIDILIAKVREAISLLKEFRTALISAAVTGKIDVRNEAA
jgi:type I restriction enzyme S subunit